MKQAVLDLYFTPKNGRELWNRLYLTWTRARFITPYRYSLYTTLDIGRILSDGLCIYDFKLRARFITPCLYSLYTTLDIPLGNYETGCTWPVNLRSRARFITPYLYSLYLTLDISVGKYETGVTWPVLYTETWYGIMKQAVLDLWL